MAAFSSLGIGTGGIDTQGLLDTLQNSEQMRLQPYSVKQNSYKSKISAWGSISNAMSAFQGSVKTLSNDAFNSLSVSTNKAFTAKAGTGANADTHSIRIDQLAVSHKLSSVAQKTSTDQLGDQSVGTRTITITNGGKQTVVTLKKDETSLDQIAKAINKQDGGTNASVQRTASGYQLLLSAKNSGTDGEMKVEVTGDSQLSKLLDTSHGGKGNTDPMSANDAMTQVSAAQNAKLNVDGMAYERSTNNITDIITDVTLVLNDKSDPTTGAEQLTLTRNNSAIKNSVNDFVEKYNSLLKLTSAASKYVKNDTSGLSNDDVAKQNNQNGALMGDSTLRGMVSEIRTTANGLYGDGNSKISALADLGIKIDAATGQMTVDDTKLDSVVTDNPEAVASMFMGQGTQDGLAAKLTTIVTKYVGDPSTKTDGVIKTSTNSLDEQVKIMQTQLDKTQKLIDAQVDHYRTQFQKLDTSMSKMTNLSSQLTGMLAKL